MAALPNIATEMAHVECFEEMIGGGGGDRVRRGRDGDETGDETGGPRDETDDKTAATAGDKRDGGDRRDIVCGRRSVYNRRPPC